MPERFESPARARCRAPRLSRDERLRTLGEFRLRRGRPAREEARRWRVHRRMLLHSKRRQEIRSQLQRVPPDRIAGAERRRRNRGEPVVTIDPAVVGQILVANYRVHVAHLDEVRDVHVA